jgi:hypothetical protein
VNAPAINLGFGGVLGLGALALVAGLGLLVYVKRKEIAAAVNPLSSDNLAYKGASSVTEALTGGAETTVGGAFAQLREWLSGDDARIREMLKGTVPHALTPPSEYVAGP